MKPILLVEQKITAFVNQYRVFGVDAAGNKGQLIAFAQQKRIAFKEKVRFYADEAKTQEIFGFRAEKVLDVHGRYFVEDTQNAYIGGFKKVFGKSLFNSTWQILQGDTPVVTITESNQVLAVLRRFVGFLPVVGDLLEFVLLFFRYHFVLKNASGQVIGKYEKTTLFRDHYKLSMTPEAYQSLDWRVLASMAVALDALQSR